VNDLIGNSTSVFDNLGRVAERAANPAPLVE
jgi:hypothetical protein